MLQNIDFAYQSACDAAGFPATVSIFNDRSFQCTQIAEDLSEAGFRMLHGGKIEDLLEGSLALLGDVVMLDCEIVSAQRMAAFARLDMRVAQSGAQLIVETSLDALDDVFACFDQSSPQILVTPSRAERIVAIGRVLAIGASDRVRELSKEDRAALRQLTQQVEQIARRIEGLSSASGQAREDKLCLKDAKPAFRGFAKGVSDEPLVKSSLPDPRVVREIIRHRQARARLFDAELFSDPAWDMLLDLTAADAECTRVSVTSLCIASGVPATTALRWIAQMVEAGLFERLSDTTDKRRAFISLSDKARDAMARYFAEIGQSSQAIAA